MKEEGLRLRDGKKVGTTWTTRMTGMTEGLKDNVKIGDDWDDGRTG